MDLSVIVLSYNTKEITDECLRRLKASGDRLQKSGQKVQVIVLDNASSDGSAEEIAKNHPWVELIESKENTGYSKGNNIAFKKAKYPSVIFLNSDVYVENDTLQKAAEYFVNHNCDILGIKLTFENGAFQPSAGYLPTPLNTILWILGIGQMFNPFHPKSKTFFSKEKEVGWVMGAFFMIKKNVFEKLGGFDEGIFMYMDEVDLCKRAGMKGFKVCFTPLVEVTHLHRASSKDNPERVFTSEIKGMKVYFQKYYATTYPLVKIFLIIGLILRILAFSIIGKTARARAYMDGLKMIND